MSRNNTGRGRIITKREIDRALDLRATGCTWAEVGHTIGRSPNAIRNAVVTGFPDEHEEALEQFRDRLRRERRERALDREDKWSAKFLDDLSMEQLPETRAARKPAEEKNEEGGRSDIAEAIDRFTALVGNAIAGGRAELPAGEADGRGESAPRVPVEGLDSET